jgi:MYXO-CTERM domain-containing protein
MSVKPGGLPTQLIGPLLLVSVPFCLGSGAAKAALTVSASTDAALMAAALLGPGANLVAGSASYTGSANASGFFNGDTTIFGQPAGVNGVLLTSGSVANALGPNNSTSASAANGVAGSPYLSSLIGGATTRDASTLTFKVTLDPGVSGLEWTYVFGSEEYNEFVNSSFNDVFALSLDGTNLALIPGTSTPVSINNVNAGNPKGSSCKNCSFYVDNSPGSSAGGVPGPVETQYDGLTSVLKSTALGLKPGVEYTLSFAIADTGDSSLDSGVFLLGGSVKDSGPTNSVPGPLPLLGAAAAFGWSRRLRRRISAVEW